MDFMSDSMVGNRKFRILNIMDDYSREVLAIEVDTSLSSRREIRTLDRIIEQRGKPVSIWKDNDPEFTSKDLELWSLGKGINFQFIQPGKTLQNEYIERFNRLYSEAILDAYLFIDLNEVRVLTDERIEGNTKRSHESLGDKTPYEWKMNLIKNDYALNKTVWN
jgi:putative transposase